MKKILASLLLLVSTFAITSCNDDGPSIPSYIGMGTLQKPADQYAITFDGGSTCYVPDSSLLVYNQLQQPGKRVIAIYNYLNNRRDDTTIQLQDIMGVLTKPLAPKPETPADQATLGGDLLRVEKAWLGGGYLNVKFYYLTDASTGNPHFINAFDTGEIDQDGSHIIEMRHNANNHLPHYVTRSNYVSFNLPGSEDGKTTYKLRYQYSTVEQITVHVSPK